MVKLRLDRLADLLGVHRQRAFRFHAAGLIGGENYGRGRGRGVLFRSRDEARCAVAVLLLARLLPAKRAKRAIGRALDVGCDVLTLGIGANGVDVLSNGQGDHLPLVDAAGQGMLFVSLDLRRMRAEIERIVDRLAHED